MAAPPNQPEDERKNHAENKRCCQREVDRGVLAAIGEITGQTAKRKMKLTGKNQDCAENKQNGAKNQQEFAEIKHHPILEEQIKQSHVSGHEFIRAERQFRKIFFLTAVGGRAAKRSAYFFVVARLSFRKYAEQ